MNINRKFEFDYVSTMQYSQNGPWLCDWVILGILLMNHLIPLLDYILLDTKIMSPAFLNLILAILGRNGT